jgi:hypothetical protein
MAIQSFSVGQVLTAAQVNALQANDYNQTVSNKTASYTLVAADKGTRIAISSTSATTITVNESLFSAGDTLFIQNLNSGVSTITAGTATVTTSASLALAQWEGGTLYFTSASAAIFFKSDGAAAASGGMTLLTTHTLSGSTSSISSISGSYKSLFGVITGATTNGSGANWQINPNGSNAITNNVWLSSYSSAAATNAYPALWYLNANAAKTTGGENCWSFTIDNYASTTGHKPIYLSGQFLEQNSGTEKCATYGGGGIRTNSAITSLDFVTNSGSWTAGTVLLYGVS